MHVSIANYIIMNQYSTKPIFLTLSTLSRFLPSQTRKVKQAHSILLSMSTIFSTSEDSMKLSAAVVSSSSSSLPSSTVLSTKSSKPTGDEIMPHLTMDLSSTQFPKAIQLSAEVEEGNREYKYKLTNLTKEQLIHRISQLTWRLNESLEENGIQIAIYQIGVDDDGTPLGLSPEELEESLRNLATMAEFVGCSMVVKNIYAGEIEGYLTAEVHLKKIEREMIGSIYLQIAVAGDMEAGKSTLIGVLLSGNYDNGKGLARTHVFRHNHEVQSGFTSSISNHTIYFNLEGKILNHGLNIGQQPGNRVRSRSDLEYADQACRIASFIDLAGHQKYLKTTMHGLVSYSPSYCFLCIAASTATSSAAFLKSLNQSMTVEHLGMISSLNLQLSIIITKIDQATVSMIDIMIKIISKMLATQGKIGLVISTEADLMSYLESISKANFDSYPSSTQTLNQQENKKRQEVKIVPIFLVSSLTGEGIPILQKYIFLVPILPTSTTTTTIPIASSSSSSVDTKNRNILVEEEAELRVVGSFTLGSKSSYDDNHLDLSSRVALFSHEGTSNQITNLSKSLSSSSISSSYQQSTVYPRPTFQKKITILDNLITPETVLLVNIHSGKVSIQDILWIGPDCHGKFYRVKINSLRVNDIVVRSVMRGQCATLVLDILEEGNLSQENLTSEQSRIHDLVVTMRNKYESFGNINRPITTTATIETNRPWTVITSGLDVEAATTAVAAVADVVGVQQTTTRNESAKSTLISSRGGQPEITGDETLVKIMTKVSVDPDLNPDHKPKHEQEQESHPSKSNSQTYLDTDHQYLRRTPVGLILLPYHPFELPPQAYMEFLANIIIVNHPGKIKCHYQLVIHVGNVRQTAQILSMTSLKAYEEYEHSDDSDNSKLSNDLEEILNGSRAIVRFRFLFRPEFLRLGSPLLLREGRIRGVGHVVAVFSEGSTTVDGENPTLLSSH